MCSQTCSHDGNESESLDSRKAFVDRLMFGCSVGSISLQMFGHSDYEPGNVTQVSHCHCNPVASTFDLRQTNVRTAAKDSNRQWSSRRRKSRQPANSPLRATSHLASIPTKRQVLNGAVQGFSCATHASPNRGHVHTTADYHHDQGSRLNLVMFYFCPSTGLCLAQTC